MSGVLATASNDLSTVHYTPNNIELRTKIEFLNSDNRISKIGLIVLCSLAAILTVGGILSVALISVKVGIPLICLAIFILIKNTHYFDAKKSLSDNDFDKLLLSGDENLMKLYGENQSTLNFVTRRATVPVKELRHRIVKLCGEDGPLRTGLEEAFNSVESECKYAPEQEIVFDKSRFRFDEQFLSKFYEEIKGKQSKDLTSENLEELTSRIINWKHLWKKLLTEESSEVSCKIPLKNIIKMIRLSPNINEVLGLGKYTNIEVIKACASTQLQKLNFSSGVQLDAEEAKILISMNNLCEFNRAGYMEPAVKALIENKFQLAEADPFQYLRK